MSTKKFGLILPDKGSQKPLTFQASRNVFGNDSDSDEGKSKRRPFLPSDLIKRQAKITQEKAVLEDPTVYQYDEIYDEVTSKREKEKVKSKEEKKPKYIENLMKSASKRKIENERRVERQIQKERENEGDEFKDKEVFVTSAYKKKLEELKLEEEKERREEYLESIGDVTKQSDLGGFYRHLYEQKLGKKESSDPDKKPISDAKSDKDKIENKKRNYRKRKMSNEHTPKLSEGEIEDSEEEINRLNLDDIKQAKKPWNDNENIDADSDFSIDESSDEEDGKKKVKKEKHKDKNDDNQGSTTPVIKSPKKQNDDSKKDSVEDITKNEEPKPKIDIWAKRTIGVVFDEALKRYYERKAARSC